MDWRRRDDMESSRDVEWASTGEGLVGWARERGMEDSSQVLTI